MTQPQLPNQLRCKGSSLQQELCHLPTQEATQAPSPGGRPLPRLLAKAAGATRGCEGAWPWGASRSATSPMLLKSSSGPAQSIRASDGEGKSSISYYQPPWYYFAFPALYL